MHDLRRGDADTLSARCQSGVIIITGVIEQNVIRNRGFVLIEFNTHTHVVPVAVTLIHFLINAIRFNHLQCNAVAQELPLNDAQENRAVAGHSCDDVRLQVNKAHLTVNCAATKA